MWCLKDELGKEDEKVSKSYKSAKSLTSLESQTFSDYDFAEDDISHLTSLSMVDYNSASTNRSLEGENLRYKNTSSSSKGPPSLRIIDTHSGNAKRLNRRRYSGRRSSSSGNLVYNMRQGSTGFRPISSRYGSTGGLLPTPRNYDYDSAGSKRSPSVSLHIP
eukprot:UN03171